MIATASPANFDYVKKLGADFVLDYNTEPLRERVMAITEGRGVDAILNSVGRESAQADLDLLAFGGQLACIAGMPASIAEIAPPVKAVTVHKIMLGGAHLCGDAEAQRDLASMADEFGELVATGLISPMIERSISLEEVPQALMELSRRHVRGKIVAVLDGQGEDR